MQPPGVFCIEGKSFVCLPDLAGTRIKNSAFEVSAGSWLVRFMSGREGLKAWGSKKSANGMMSCLKAT